MYSCEVFRKQLLRDLKTRIKNQVKEENQVNGRAACPMIGKYLRKRRITKIMKRRMEKEQRAIASQRMGRNDKTRYMVEEKSEALILEKLGKFHLALYKKFLRVNTNNDLGKPFSICMRLLLWSFILLYVLGTSLFVILFGVMHGPSVTAAWLLSFLVNVGFSAVIIRPFLLLLTRGVAPCLAGRLVRPHINNAVWPRVSRILELVADRAAGQTAGDTAMDALV